MWEISGNRRSPSGSYPIPRDSAAKAERTVLYAYKFSVLNSICCPVIGALQNLVDSNPQKKTVSQQTRTSRLLSLRSIGSRLGLLFALFSRLMRKR